MAGLRQHRALLYHLAGGKVLQHVPVLRQPGLKLLSTGDTEDMAQVVELGTFGTRGNGMAVERLLQVSMRSCSGWPPTVA